LNINVETQLHRRFKAACVMAGKDMKDVLIAYMRSFADQRMPAPPARKGGRS
jgi:hypothetical protein